MGVTREGYVFTGGVIALYILVTVFVLLSPPLAITDTAIRLAALLGLLSLSIAVITVPFIPVMTGWLGTPFLRIHHSFACAGLLGATIHPLLYAWTVASAAVFLPLYGSWHIFFSTSGRVALPLIYLAAGAVLFRRAIPRYWRSLHLLMYLALFLAVVHGNLIGTDFSHPVVRVVFNGLALVAAGVFLFRRYRKGEFNRGNALRQNWE
ncbi:MAG TPA: hypothetical protein PK069_01295 [Methanolinea sp.]|mgnify:CR=1 FL=1|nr:hypothetical protein [Methanolinea sp.]HQK55090.1 hypothetical protein [Methanolinea sp.]